MKTRRNRSAYLLLAVMVSISAFAVIAACSSTSQPEECAPSQTIFLRTALFNKTMPDGSDVLMAGYAADSGFGAQDGIVSSPGPAIKISPCATSLTIYLDNNLPEPTSLVINGQTQLNMTPAYYGNGRVRSFTHETPPGNSIPVAYEFPNFRDGTFIYTSGTHPAVQRQMGLYGAVYKSSTPPLAYERHAYDMELLVLYSEIDPVIHQAVATDNFGPGKTVTSTIDYSPKYYLANGAVYDKAAFNVPPAFAGKRILMRLLNAGSITKTPMLLGGYGMVIAEDGNPYANPTNRYSIKLPAGQTKEVIIVPGSQGMDFFIDRSMNIPNVAAAPGAPPLLARLPIGE